MIKVGAEFEEERTEVGVYAVAITANPSIYRLFHTG
jgi:hypothetical protein